MEVLDTAMTSRCRARIAAKLLKPQSRRGAVPLLTHTTEFRPVMLRGGDVTGRRARFRVARGALRPVPDNASFHAGAKLCGPDAGLPRCMERGNEPEGVMRAFSTALRIGRQLQPTRGAHHRLGRPPDRRRLDPSSPDCGPANRSPAHEAECGPYASSASVGLGSTSGAGCGEERLPSSRRPYVRLSRGFPRTRIAYSLRSASYSFSKLRVTGWPARAT